jgi:2-C-methyl-D-erythritol 2,4-cyclodiphosphate synthase
VSQAVITRCLEAIARHGAAVVATPLADTVKRAAPEGYVDVTVDRRHLWGAQTPQGARLGLLMEAYARALAEDWAVTDDAGVLERVGHRVQLVEGESVNFKVTRPEDLALAERLLGGPRIGMGYDVHRLVEGRPLVLGGVTIPHTHGLAGHSDADVLTHAIMDALLGAAALGDIGRHFPDTDPTYKGADSLTLLAAVVAKLAALGLHPAHVDATLVAQAPKVAPYVDTMRERLASMLGLPLGRVSVKATTTEGLGFAGDGSGMAAYATVSVLG